MLRFLILYLFLSACTSSEKILPMKTLRRSIFKIHVISKEPRFSQPWLYQSSSRSSGSGFYIGDDRIVTNAHVVAHGKFISVQRDGDAQPTPARVEFIAHDSDLAILRVNDRAALEGSRPLKFGELPGLQDKVATVGYPRGGEQISVTEGVVSRMSYRRYAHPGYDRHLLIQVDSAINPGNSGGPVFKGDRVVGVAFQAHTNAENTGYIIPTPVVKRFLKDIEDGRYDGHPEDVMAEIEGALENHGTRAYHGLDEPRGIKLAFLAPYSPISKDLQQGDVILEINGYEIGVDGKINFFDERVDFRVVYDLAQLGDTITFKVLRNDKEISIAVVVQANSAHYNPSNTYTLRPRYIVYGGLVFTALSRDYLKAWGDRWYFNAPLKLRYLHRYFYLEERFKSAKEIIVLADILPDEVNIDANGFKEEILDRVGNRPISSLEELDQALQKADGDDLTIKFWREGLPLVVEPKKLRDAHEKLIRRYRVEPDRWLGDERQDGAVAGGDLP
ncbi:S1C family serine protease [Pseudobacteriovorax antillogorgiicola]|uniref:Serine protease, S1-C subfamily, contains C-terminal PDZ domain n=1 Tax=Pseudobacteriovorax antillogorgiicola TaxID=1513793 RepID=A0A1Y6C629_9BACT|nr:S1C family serine protease [Pseudobacteriovorax antillogorgiicola]TCS51149.1 S1-C subfamily serine protease [Pseudobacteriovorax antillogorgiicola]SMF38261.1 serine protease, S1-C subfamily, contains C-terminal PDZ domain [Pseudobacteriovorax antillogorgiicola]